MKLLDTFGEYSDFSTMLEYLYDRRIFNIDKVNGKFIFTESCDDYFSVTLTKDQVIILANELLNLAKD